MSFWQKSAATSIKTTAAAPHPTSISFIQYSFKLGEQTSEDSSHQDVLPWYNKLPTLSDNSM